MIEVYYAYNKSFQHYHDLPLAGKRAHDFIEKRNQEKGGVWELHTVEQHMKWYESVGKFKEDIKFIKDYGIVPSH
jgi:hypothetical protein